MSADPYREFRLAVGRPEEQIDLARAALAMVNCDYPHLEVDAYLTRIDELAGSAKQRLGSEPDVDCSIAALNAVLFQQSGFQGNRENYFDPKNSFLNEVLDRKIGIPISLSVLYMEVARRIGLPLHGVGFPGHFLVKYSGDREEILIDPFNQGEIRSHESLEAMLDKLYGQKVSLNPEFLESISKKQIFKRMLNNLKSIYLRANDLMRGLSVVERLVILEPAAGSEIRDRGILYLKLECFKQARDDLETYLRLVPQAEDADAVRQQVTLLTKRVAQLH